MKSTACAPAAIEVMRATKTKEPGCLQYAYAIDVIDKASLRIIERWTDEAALAAHFATPHLAVSSQTIASAKITAASVKVILERSSARSWNASVHPERRL